MLNNKSGRDISDSISLLISILVRYPEVSTINFDPEIKALKFTFVITGDIDEDNLLAFKEELKNSSEVFNMLENQRPTILEVGEHLTDNLTLIEVKRDVATLTQEEISLYIALLRKQFNKTLVSEENDSILEEDLLVQEELIEHILENLKITNQDKKLIAFREEGKVLVFNK